MNFMKQNRAAFIKQLKKNASLLADKIYFPLLLSGAIKRFRKERRGALDFEASWELSNRFAYGLKRKSLNFNLVPFQKKLEIASLVKTVAEAKPKIILEIGTAGGGTLFYWTQAAAPDATIISIDLPFGRFGAGYLPTKAKFLKSLAQADQKICLIAADSHQEETFKKLTALLQGRKIDFLFIDGDHTYSGVKADFTTYGNLVGPGGLIALHDIIYHQFDPEAEVYKFWQEIKEHYRTEEYVEAEAQDGYGLGLIHF